MLVYLDDCGYIYYEFYMVFSIYVVVYYEIEYVFNYFSVIGFFVLVDFKFCLVL